MFRISFCAFFYVLGAVVGQQYEVWSEKFPQLPKIQNGMPATPQNYAAPVKSVEDLRMIFAYSESMAERVRRAHPPHIGLYYETWIERDVILKEMEDAKIPILITEITANSHVLPMKILQQIFASHPVRKFVLRDYSSFDKVKSRQAIEELASQLRSVETLEEFETTPRLYMQLTKAFSNLKSISISCDQFYDVEGWTSALQSIFQENRDLRALKMKSEYCNEDTGLVLQVLKEFQSQVEQLNIGPLSDNSSVQRLTSYFSAGPKGIKEIKAHIGVGVGEGPLKKLAQSLKQAPRLRRAYFSVNPAAKMEKPDSLTAFFNELPNTLENKYVTCVTGTIAQRRGRTIETKSISQGERDDSFRSLMTHLSRDKAQHTVSLEFQALSLTKLAEGFRLTPSKKVVISSLQIKHLLINQPISSETFKGVVNGLQNCLSFELKSNVKMISEFQKSLKDNGYKFSDWEYGNDRIFKESKSPAKTSKARELLFISLNHHRKNSLTQQ